LSSPMATITRVTSLKVLDVTINSRMSVSEHVSTVISSCAQSIYVLRILRAHGMNNNVLQLFYRSVVIAKLLYAASAWWGYTSANDRQRLTSLIKRGVRSGLCSDGTPLLQAWRKWLIQLTKLYSNASCPTLASHVLHQFLPDRRTTGHYLRLRNHDRVLPPKTGSLLTINFLIRMLYKECY